MSFISTVANAVAYVYTAAVGGVVRTLTSKLNDVASAYDFGVAGDGVTDDTAALNLALTRVKHVIVPAGCTPLISGTINIPQSTKLEFKGGLGKTTGVLPASYLIKKSTFNGNAVTLQSCAMMIGGGVVGQAGNGGDGIVIVGNTCKVRDSIALSMGGNGVRIGTDAGGNYNSWELDHVDASYNTGHGIYIHDGKLTAGADANAALAKQCSTLWNGGSGIYLQHCFWVTVLDHLSERNTGYGIYLSGANDTTGVPQCRYATVIGGDFNEGNTAGQLFDQSYRSVFINPDPNNVPTTASSGLAGSAERLVLGVTSIFSIAPTIKTGNGAYPFTIDDGTAGSLSYPVQLVKTTTAGNGQGLGIEWNITASAVTYTRAGAVRVQQSTTGVWSMILSAYYSGAAQDMLYLNALSPSVIPATDNTLNLGTAGNRWVAVYAVNGTIQTSDANAKQDIRPLTDAEIAVAKACKGLVRLFRMVDAVKTKGDAARLHCGVISQQVHDAFAAQGLDAARYGIWCSDTWHVDSAGRAVTQAEDGTWTALAGDTVDAADVSERTQQGVRYDELLAFIIAAL